LSQIRGRFDEAKADLNRAVELDPTSANMISDLGDIKKVKTCPIKKA